MSKLNTLLLSAPLLFVVLVLTAELLWVAVPFFSSHEDGIDYSSHGHPDTMRFTSNVVLQQEEAVHGKHGCGTREPGPDDFVQQTKAVKFDAFRREQRFGESRERAELQEAEEVITIPICFHIPWSIFGSLFGRRITNNELQDNLDHMNAAFSSQSCCDVTQTWCKPQNRTCSVDTPFRFTMAKVLENKRRTKTYQISGETTPNVNDDKACVIRAYAPRLRSVTIGGDSEVNLKKARLGDASVLNIFLTNPVYGGNLAEGFAVFPWDYTSYPQLDGIIVQPSTLKGGRHPFANEGDTLVHESAHWLGLFHTFSGGCTPAGDGIADTPAESSFHSGCYPETDSCPDSPGDDPIFNFMDYSDDVCMFEFTAGQVAVMKANYRAYRSSSPINYDPVVLQNGILAGPFGLASTQMRMFTFDVASADTTVVCRTVSNDGNLDVYMNWNGEMGDFGCAGTSFYSTNDVCALNGGPGTVHVLVYAAKSAPAFSVVCKSADISEPPVALVDKVSSLGHSLTAGGAKLFTLDVSSSSIASVACSVNFDQGSLSLIGSWDADVRSASCSTISDGKETIRCMFDYSLADAATLLVVANEDTSLFSVQCSKDVYAGQLLSDNVMQVGNLAGYGAFHLYALETPGPLTIVTCTANIDGAANLKMEWKADFPGCYSIVVGVTQRVCSIGPSQGVALIEVFALAQSKYTLTCSGQPAIALTNGVTSTAYSLATNGFKLFYVEASSAWSYVTCTIVSNSENLVLSMNWNGVYGSYQCESERKSCTIGPVLDKAFAIVKGVSATKSFSIRCQSHAEL